MFNRLVTRVKVFARNNPRKYALYWKVSALIVGIGLLFLLWFIVSQATNHSIVPKISTTFIELFKGLGSSRVLLAILHTLGRLLLALLLFGGCAIIIGSISGYYSYLEYVLKPIIIVLRSFPTVALIFILIIYSNNAALYLVGLVLFPLIYESTLTGIKNTKDQYKDLLALEGNRKFINLPRVVFPLSLEYIAVGITQSIGLGLKVLIMGETFMGSTSFKGLGFEIYRAYLDYDMSRVFAYSLIAITFVLIFDLLTLYLKNKMKSNLLDKGHTSFLKGK